MKNANRKASKFSHWLLQWRQRINFWDFDKKQKTISKKNNLMSARSESRRWIKQTEERPALVTFIVPSSEYKSVKTDRNLKGVSPTNWIIMLYSFSRLRCFCFNFLFCFVICGKLLPTLAIPEGYKWSPVSINLLKRLFKCLHIEQFRSMGRRWENVTQKSEGAHV